MLGAGLAVRFAILPLAPTYGYPWDHDDMVRWGIQAADHGLRTLYDVPAPRHDFRLRQQDGWVVVQRSLDRRFVYPPLMAYPVALAGRVHQWISPDRTGNTVTSRVLFSAVSIVCDVLLAFGCGALAAALGTASTGLWPFAMALLAPPFWLDSSLWGQVDSVVLAPLVWMVWAMCRGRWIAAGALFGAALMAKPQAILLGPLWLLAVLTSRPRWRPLPGLAIAALTVGLVSLPFTWHSGSSWWRLSYVANLTTEFPATTLKAFNAWYADALVHQTLDVQRRWAGLSMDAWGRAALAAALLAGLVGVLRRWGRKPHALVIWAAITTLSSVMLATRVHDRYILLTLPFLIVAAALRRRFVVALVALLIVATAQLTWTHWLRTEPGGWDRVAAAARSRYEQTLAALPPEQRMQVPPIEQHLGTLRQQYLAERARTEPIEWVLVVLALGGTAAFAGAAMARDETAEPHASRPRGRGARSRPSHRIPGLG